jgi:hypothetical protein
MVDLLMDLLRESRARGMQIPGRPRRSLSGHRRVMSAIRRRDPRAAHAAMLRHIREIEEILMCAAAPAERAARDFARLRSMRSGAAAGQNDSYPTSPCAWRGSASCDSREIRSVLRFQRQLEEGARHFGVPRIA